MIKRGSLKRWTVSVPLMLLLLVAGCGINSAYRSADKKTIRDFTASDTYGKRIGILTLTNSTVFTSDQISGPFMEAFLTGVKSSAPKALMQLPANTQNAAFLMEPPRLEGGDFDVYRLCAQARQAGMNVVVSPIIMDIRTSKKDTGFWFFREVSYVLQIQTAAAAYDTTTGARLSLGILTETIDITEEQSEIVKNGQETKIDDLIEMAKTMGDQLGEQMGTAVDECRWVASIVSVDTDNCMIPVGGKMGVKPGDRFSVLDASQVITGLNGQRFIVPGIKIGDITIARVTDQNAYGTPDTGNPPPVGSIVVPDKK